MINETALCAMCGKEFKKTHSTHRYCSRKCVAKAQKMAKERFNKKVREEKKYTQRKLAEMAEAHGLDLLVENVVCNRENPMKHWCELKEKYPEIHFIFDTKMAAFHEQLDLLYEKEYEWLWKEGHIRHYHVNDYAGGYMDWKNLRTLPIGAGHVDFERFFA